MKSGQLPFPCHFIKCSHPSIYTRNSPNFGSHKWEWLKPISITGPETGSFPTYWMEWGISKYFPQLCTKWAFLLIKSFHMINAAVECLMHKWLQEWETIGKNCSSALVGKFRGLEAVWRFLSSIKRFTMSFNITNPKGDAIFCSEKGRMNEHCRLHEEDEAAWFSMFCNTSLIPDMENFNGSWTQGVLFKGGISPQPRMHAASFPSHLILDTGRNPSSSR